MFSYHEGRYCTSRTRGQQGEGHPWERLGLGHSHSRLDTVFHSFIRLFVSSFVRLFIQKMLRGERNGAGPFHPPHLALPRRSLSIPNVPYSFILSLHLCFYRLESLLLYPFWNILIICHPLRLNSMSVSSQVDFPHFKSLPRATFTAPCHLSR